MVFTQFISISEWHAEETPSDSPLDMRAALSGHEPLDCSIAHQQAIEESIRSGISNAFIPECAGNGDYLPVQCYKVVVFCRLHPLLKVLKLGSFQKLKNSGFPVINFAQNPGTGNLNLDIHFRIASGVGAWIKNRGLTSPARPFKTKDLTVMILSLRFTVLTQKGNG